MLILQLEAFVKTVRQRGKPPKQDVRDRRFLLKNTFLIMKSHLRSLIAVLMMAIAILLLHDTDASYAEIAEADNQIENVDCICTARQSRELVMPRDPEKKMPSGIRAIKDFPEVSAVSRLLLKGDLQKRYCVFRE